MNDLSNNDIMKSVKDLVTTQNYDKKLVIDGVKIFDINRYSGEDGSFEDILRINDKGFLELCPDMQIRQISRSRVIPGSVKAWHLHFKQEDLWYVPPEHHMILGLWDVREHSTTKDMTMKVVMGNGFSKLVYIPRGVAHGVANISLTPGDVFYFVNSQYKMSDPDEKRLPWYQPRKDFWEVEKG